MRCNGSLAHGVPRGKLVIRRDTALNDMGYPYVYRFARDFEGVLVSKRAVRRQQARNGGSSWKVRPLPVVPARGPF